MSSFDLDTWVRDPCPGQLCQVRLHSVFATRSINIVPGVHWTSPRRRRGAGVHLGEPVMLCAVTRERHQGEGGVPAALVLSATSLGWIGTGALSQPTERPITHD